MRLHSESEKSEYLDLDQIILQITITLMTLYKGGASVIYEITLGIREI